MPKFQGTQRFLYFRLRQPDSFSQSQNRKELSPAGLPLPFSGSSSMRNTRPIQLTHSRQTNHVDQDALHLLEKRSREFRLSNDACQRAPSERTVKRYGNRDSCLQLLLHVPMTASLTDGDESVLFGNPAHFRAGKNPEFTQPAPRPGLQRPRSEPAGRFPTGMLFRKTA